MRKRDASIRYLSKHMDKIIIASGYCILFVLILSLTPGILYQEKLIREGMWQEYREVGNDRFTIFYALNTPDNKPSICVPGGGGELLALDGFKSTISINNVENRSFWDHTFRNVVGGATVYHNMIWENYELLQTTELRENAVVIDYEIKSDVVENFPNLTLNLWHRYQKFSLLKVDNAFVNDNYSVENQAKPTYVVWVQLDPQPSIVENAPYWVNLIYSFENLAVRNVWGDPIVKITVSYSHWVD